MKAFVHIVTATDNLNEYIGRFISWFALIMAVLTTGLVLLRYGFNTGSIAWQELVTYLHAALFMLGSAYALKHKQHVRVDIFYHRFSARTRAWIDACCCLIFLLPLCVFIIFISWDMVCHSWAIREASADTGGLPGIFLLKTLIPATALLLLLQGISEFFRACLVLIEVSNND